MGWVGFILGPLLLAAGYIAGRASLRHRVATPSPERPARPATWPDPVAPPPVAPAPAEVRRPLPPPDPKEAIYAAAVGANEDFDRSVQPAHMLGALGFEDCVEAMRTSPLSNTDLLGFYTGDSAVLAVCAAEAIARRPPDRRIRERLLTLLNSFHFYTRFFGLRAITAATPATESVVGLVLPKNCTVVRRHFGPPRHGPRAAVFDRRQQPCSSRPSTGRPWATYI